MRGLGCCTGRFFARNSDSNNVVALGFQCLQVVPPQFLINPYLLSTSYSAPNPETKKAR